MEKQIVENRLGNFYDQKRRHNETETYLSPFSMIICNMAIYNTYFKKFYDIIKVKMIKL